MAKRKTTKKAKWPQERKVLFRPDRYKYIRGQRDAKPGAGSCVFCQAFKMGVGESSLVLFETPLARVVLNKFPYNPGHLMILPVRHEGEILSLNDNEYEEVMRLIRTSVKVLKKAFEVKEFNVGMNLGKNAGAGIPEHLHVHVLPRWAGDSNFFPLIAETKAVPMSLEQAFASLAPLFEQEGRQGI